MVKITLGPLASGLSGTLGDITFEQTRFGQVAQRKPTPPVHTSSKATTAKARFAEAMKVLTLHGGWWSETKFTGPGPSDRSLTGMWVQAYITHRSRNQSFLTGRESQGYTLLNDRPVDMGATQEMQWWVQNPNTGALFAPTFVKTWQRSDPTKSILTINTGLVIITKADFVSPMDSIAWWTINISPPLGLANTYFRQIGFS